MAAGWGRAGDEARGRLCWAGSGVAVRLEAARAGSSHPPDMQPGLDTSLRYSREAKTTNLFQGRLRGTLGGSAQQVQGAPGCSRGIVSGESPGPPSLPFPRLAKRCSGLPHSPPPFSLPPHPDKSQQTGSQRDLFVVPKHTQALTRTNSTHALLEILFGLC